LAVVVTEMLRENYPLFTFVLLMFRWENFS